MATEANLICYRGRTGVRERSEEVLFIHSLPRKVSSNEETMGATLIYFDIISLSEIRIQYL